MSTFLNLGRDVQGYPTKGAEFSKDMFSATLAAGSAKSVTVPASHQKWLMRVKVQPNEWCWVSKITTAAVPAGSSIATTTSAMAVGTLLNEWVVLANDVISFITASTTCDVGIELFPISYP